MLLKLLTRCRGTQLVSTDVRLELMVGSLTAEVRIHVHFYS